MSSYQGGLLLLMLNLALMLYPSGSKSSNSEFAEILHRPIRSFGFPEESTAALYFTFAVPLEEPYKAVTIADFFEATYTLPTNFSQDFAVYNTESRRKRRSLDRATLYQVIEKKFTKPTSSRHERLPQDVLQAEVAGRNGSCANYRPRCPVGLFDLIGVLG
ncbi:unnamed protein product [Xylocopa violacea]|uniref:Uncharacterized protein n=1 Tax=Xylocopa violacea TaxID=135666 RepID=A0ABP1NFH5_XYLVO